MFGRPGACPASQTRETRSGSEGSRCVRSREDARKIAAVDVNGTGSLIKVPAFPPKERVY
jgi:hypothetical protein